MEKIINLSSITEQRDKAKLTAKQLEGINFHCTILPETSSMAP